MRYGPQPLAYVAPLVLGHIKSRISCFDENVANIA